MERSEGSNIRQRKRWGGYTRKLSVSCREFATAIALCSMWIQTGDGLYVPCMNNHYILLSSIPLPRKGHHLGECVCLKEGNPGEETQLREGSCQHYSFLEGGTPQHPLQVSVQFCSIFSLLIPKSPVPHNAFLLMLPSIRALRESFLYHPYLCLPRAEIKSVCANTTRQRQVFQTKRLFSRS